MSHAYDTQPIERKIFELLNLCYAAKEFATKHDMSEQENFGSIGPIFYNSWLKYTVSEMLIDISIRTRIFHDEIIRMEKDSGEYSKKSQYPSFMEDEKLRHDNAFAVDTLSSEKIGIRDVCNKIIHAEHVELTSEKGLGSRDFDSKAKTKLSDWYFWSSHVLLTGELHGVAWEVDLDVGLFARCLFSFLQDIAETYDWQSSGQDCNAAY